METELRFAPQDWETARQSTLRVIATVLRAFAVILKEAEPIEESPEITISRGILRSLKLSQNDTNSNFGLASLTMLRGRELISTKYFEAQKPKVLFPQRNQIGKQTVGSGHAGGKLSKPCQARIYKMSATVFGN